MSWKDEEELAEQIEAGVSVKDHRPSQIDWPKTLVSANAKPPHKPGHCIIRSCQKRVKKGALCEECRAKIDARQSLFE
jgi:hypothetical protein